MSFTVLGAGGFIGRHLVARLVQRGESVVGLTRAAWTEAGPALWERPLGHVIYAIGLTADFRQRPFDTVQAHVMLLHKLLQQADFDSLTYLSSTRVYAGSASTDVGASLSVNPGQPGDLYNLSKLMGESLCLNCGRPARVARLSNVYGPDFQSQNFLTQVLLDAARDNRVTVRTAPSSAKDYVALSDVVDWLITMAQAGTRQIYNLATGTNVSVEAIAAGLRRSGVQVDFAFDEAPWTFPPIDAAQTHAEFFVPRGQLLADLPALLTACREHLTGHGGTTAVIGHT